jgi:protein gp37
VAYLNAMADGSGIEWTEATWNPTTGCDRISPGCENCYAVVRPVTSFQVLKRWAISLRYSWAWSR